MNYPKISIVTASYNHGHYIEETIKSILQQGYPNIEYIIIDGGSTDNTIDIIKKYEDKIAYWVSEKDRGVCDAIDKGFKIATGEIMGCINSDDLMHRKSLFILAEIFSEFPQIMWLTGATTIFDEMGRGVSAYQSRNFTKFDFIEGDFKWMQLESTFWRRSLYVKAGNYFDSKLTLASDFELWIRFFHFSGLHLTDALLGGFRARGSNQLSLDHLDKYLDEVRQVIDRQLWDVETLRIVKKLRRLRRIRMIVQRFLIVGKSRAINKINGLIDVASGPSAKLYFDRKLQKFRI